jgi:hypothetical protein
MEASNLIDKSQEVALSNPVVIKDLHERKSVVPTASKRTRI